MKRKVDKEDFILQSSSKRSPVYQQKVGYSTHPTVPVATSKLEVILCIQKDNDRDWITFTIILRQSQQPSRMYPLENVFSDFRASTSLKIKVNKCQPVCLA